MKNYNYIKTLTIHCCITTFLILLSLIPLIVTKLINIDNILKSNYDETNPILFLFSFLISLNIWFLLANFYSYWLSFINLILSIKILTENKILKRKEKWLIFVPFLNSISSFLILKRLSLFEKINYYNHLPIKKMFIIYSIYFGIMFSLFTTPAYFYIIDWFSEYLNVHLIVIVIIWSIILNIVFWIMSGILLVIAFINTFKSFDYYYQANNKKIQKLNLKLYLFFPFIVTEKILNNINVSIISKGNGKESSFIN